MQPSDSSFYDPARLPKPASMSSATFCQFGKYLFLAQSSACRLGVIATITLDDTGLSQRAARLAGNRRNGRDKRQQLGYIVGIRARQDSRERDAFLVGDEVVLTAEFAPVDRTGSCFFPANIARTEELSTMARAKSSWSRSRNSASKTRWMPCHTPAFCQATNRLQQIVPEPYPISCGSKFQGMPERSTKTMPVNTARSSIGFRPAYCRLRGGRFGNNGSIRNHSSSSISSFGIALSPEKIRQKVNTVTKKLIALFTMML